MSTETNLIRVYVDDHSDIMKEYHERRGQGEKIDVADIMAEKLKRAAQSSPERKLPRDIRNERR